MKTQLELYFEKFKNNIIGENSTIETPYGNKKMLYADWIASGRIYKPIEEIMQNKFAPMVGNTHSETSETGVFMTRSYELAKHIIKEHVNANENDILLTCDSGMTRAINKLIRLLGFKMPDSNAYFYETTNLNVPAIEYLGNDKPVVFITHFEHHSHQITWVESIADVVIIPPNKDLTFSLENMEIELSKYKDRRIKIGAFSGGSNVTGYIPPIHEMAKIMHNHGGLCFIDFAASAPYIKIDMHPIDKDAYFDAIYFSPHKFLGGPGSSAVLIFNKKLYHNLSPDHPGGGTVKWTNPWNGISYYDDIETREDGGTPAFLQTIRTALSIKVKVQMGCENIEKRENELLNIAFQRLSKFENIHLLADNIKDRIGVISFFAAGIHHNLIVKILNDRFGIQARGGCSCAGTYGHYLFHIDRMKSSYFTKKIDSGDSTEKPGWVRISLHPTLTNDELNFMIDAIEQILANIKNWKEDYYQEKSGEWFHKEYKFDNQRLLDSFILE